jgi:hypothetical protein
MMSESFDAIAQSVSRLSPRRSEFSSWPYLVGFSLDRMAWEIAVPLPLHSPPSKALIIEYVCQISKTLLTYTSPEFH